MFAGKRARFKPSPGIKLPLEQPMKRLTVCLVVGALALAGILTFNRRPAADIPPVVATKTSPATSVAPIAPVKISAPPASASVAKTSADAEKPFAAFENFSQWAKAFTNGTVSLIEGERLAWKRREAMVELIQADPKRALELAVPFELRQVLPKQVTDRKSTRLNSSHG